VILGSTAAQVNMAEAMMLSQKFHAMNAL